MILNFSLLDICFFLNSFNFRYARYTQGTSYNTILYYIGIPSSIIQVIVSAILLYGIFKGQPKLLKIWIVYSYVNLGLSVKSLVVIIALVNNQILGLITLVSSCIGFALLWYFNKIVSAHRDNLVEGKHTGRQTAENPGYQIQSYDKKVVDNSRF